MLAVPETGKARGSQGEQLWMGENLPDGAIFTYWLKDAPRTRRQQRQDAFRAAEQKKETPRYPSQEELTAEADEEAPQTLMTITDAAARSCAGSRCPARAGSIATSGTCAVCRPRPAVAAVWRWRRRWRCDRRR